MGNCIFKIIFGCLAGQGYQCADAGVRFGIKLQQLLQQVATGLYTTHTISCCMASATNCIKQFQWLIQLFWPIRFDVTIVSIGNNCNVKPDWPEPPLGTIVTSNLIGQNHHMEQNVKSNLIGQNCLVNQRNPLYNWVQYVRQFKC